MTRRIKQWLGLMPKPVDWNARLQEMVDECRNSFAVRDYAKRREAMLKITRAA